MASRISGTSWEVLSLMVRKWKVDRGVFDPAYVVSHSSGCLATLSADTTTHLGCEEEDDILEEKREERR